MKFQQKKLSRKILKPLNKGFSLLEMMIVLAVLAGMAAIAYPLVSRPLSKIRLKSAAQEVTNELSKARISSMQSGVPLVFRVQMKTGHFQLSRNFNSEESENESEEESEENFKTEEGDLPSGVCFESVENAKLPEEDTDESGWTNVAIFYPNGDTTDSIIELSDNDYCCDVKLSGFVNSAKISDTRKFEKECNNED